MIHQTIQHVSAYIVLISAAFLALIDGLSEADVDWALRIKWSAFWYVTRYISMTSGVFLALDTIF